jgi:FAD/FMN-containing dehydrogenase
VVGPAHALRDSAAMEGYLTEWRGLWKGRSPLVLRPADTGEVSRILAIAHETGTAIVPQSGNTGLVGGQIPDESGTEVVLSLDRMTRVLGIDSDNFTITAEAGATLAKLQDAAAEADRLLPLSLASEGSCRIGGNLATNAGGLNVLAFGTARDLCLGLEVVLADGRVWNGMRALRKDNTGYDLKNLFIGSEGTLGIITACVMKLAPRPGRIETALLAVPSPAAAVELLSRLKHTSSNRIIAFELMPAFGLELASRHLGLANPLASSSPWFVLTDLADAVPGGLEAGLAKALDLNLMTDAVIASSDNQRKSLWALREGMSEAQKREGASIKHDVAAPVSAVPSFIADAMEGVARFMPKSRVVCFGHLGDGNMHFNISQPVDMAGPEFLRQWKEMSDIVFSAVQRHGGTISAEHGIGRLKREDMRVVKSPVEIDLMRQLKNLLDPTGILNPNKVLPSP